MPRETAYASEIVSASLKLQDGEEARIERLFIKSQGHEEIRFSWWKNGKIVPRPLDLPERDIIRLLRKGIEEGVLSEGFTAALAK